MKASFLRLFLNPCDSRGIQTHNLLIRSQMLYSVELGSLFATHFRIAVAKVRSFFDTAKFFPHFFRKRISILKPLPPTLNHPLV